MGGTGLQAQRALARIGEMPLRGDPEHPARFRGQRQGGAQELRRAALRLQGPAHLRPGLDGTGSDMAQPGQRIVGGFARLDHQSQRHHPRAPAAAPAMH